ncbi:YrzE family protein [Collimonas sp.]|jgi:hypothetical protein|uniref:YrzE family protein n=1 Tax=Collimonas sp. TaxID=1963772 RepID=UPI002B94E0C2|nr:YrzE family protein [Collimonas sp.]HWX00691.1 YrzE family protein [Collimonas sp.]
MAAVRGRSYQFHMWGYMEIYNDNIEQRPAMLRFGWGISWSAVLAGFFLSLVIYLLLTVLGTAIGAGAVDPLGEQNPLAGAGLGVGIWLAVSTLVSLFFGAFISGRAAPRQGALHGLLTWALMTVAGTWLLASLASGVTGAAANMVGSGLSLAGRSVAAAAPGIASGVKDQLQQRGIEFDWGNMQDQLNGLLHDTGKQALQPGQLKADAKDAAGDASRTAQQAGAAPQAAGDDLAQWFARVKQKALPALDAADKDALVNIVAARSGKSRQEAQKIVDSYAQTYDAALAKYQQLKAQAEQQTREAAASAARGVSKAAWSSLAILVIGALVASFGGWFGLRLRPRVP